MAGPLSLCRSPVDARGAWQGAAALDGTSLDTKRLRGPGTPLPSCWLGSRQNRSPGRMLPGTRTSVLAPFLANEPKTRALRSSSTEHSPSGPQGPWASGKTHCGLAPSTWVPESPADLGPKGRATVERGPRRKGAGALWSVPGAASLSRCHPVSTGFSERPLEVGDQGGSRAARTAGTGAPFHPHTCTHAPVHTSHARAHPHTCPLNRAWRQGAHTALPTVNCHPPPPSGKITQHCAPEWLPDVLKRPDKQGHTTTFVALRPFTPATTECSAVLGHQGLAPARASGPRWSRPRHPRGLLHQHLLGTRFSSGAQDVGSDGPR